jgi:hypothetical protein
MTKPDPNARLRLDLNNPVFQENLLTLQKSERHSALETLKKLRQMTWNQVYRDGGLKWEKIIGVPPPPGTAALYSLRISQSRRATAYRDGDFMRLLTIAPDHDATYGRK